MLSKILGNIKNLKNVEKIDSKISLDFVVSVLGLSGGLLIITSK